MRLRLAYRKTGLAVYRGHLDLVRLLPRMLRRAGMPLWYTEGFHPRPDMVFGPALALGVASLREFLDLRLDADLVAPKGSFSLDRMVERLNAVSETGIEFLEACALERDDPGISKVIDEAEYVAGVPRTVLEERALADLDALRSHIAARRESGSLVVRRDIEGLGKYVDVAPYLLDVEVGVGGEALDAAGLVGALVPLRFRVRITGQGSAKGSEVVEALLGASIPHRLVRVGLFALRDGRRVDPLDRAALRGHAPASSGAEPRPAAAQMP
jgi:radical SAM-linked protein